MTMPHSEDRRRRRRRHLLPQDHAPILRLRVVRQNGVLGVYSYSKES